MEKALKKNTCESSRKNTILKSIHNGSAEVNHKFRLVNPHVKIQFLNQFTTLVKDLTTGLTL